MGWRFIVALLFAVVVSLFAIQNAAVVSVNFITWKLQISMALVILLSAIVGSITVMLLSMVRWLKTQSKISQQAKTISRLEKEVHDVQAKLDEANARFVEIPTPVTQGQTESSQMTSN